MNRIIREGAALIVCAVVLSACSDEQDPGVVAPATRQASLVPVEVTGTINGPNGTNICGWFPASFAHSVRIIKFVEAGPDVNITTRNMTCPNNTFTVSLEPGTYVIRGISDAGTGGDADWFPRLPFVKVEVTAENPNLNIVYEYGLPVGGRASMNGVYMENYSVSFRPLMTDVPGFNFSSFGISSATGKWHEDFVVDRPSVHLQPGMAYSATCSGMGGAVQTSASPSPFTPGEDLASRTFNCAFRTSKAAGWTHTNTQLDMTAGPGLYGTREYSDGNGYGFGVQYPSTTPESNLHGPESHLFAGGLMISTGNSIFASIFQHDYNLDCSAACLGLKALTTRPKVIDNGDDTKDVIWNLSDAHSPESVGLTVQQRSFDGTGGDYVLFRFVLKNNSTTNRVFNLGFLADWDVSSVGTDNTGVSGNIAWVNRTGSPFLGSVFLGNTFANRGYFAFANSNTGRHPVATQISWLDGSVTNSGANNVDTRYVQSAGGIEINAGRAKVVWFAVLGGATLAELQANAAAAEADMNARQ